MPKHRLESFSDGVFAIVITLLILNIHLDRDQELTLQTLASLGPEMLAFAPTFVIVGVYWVSHHSMMHMIKAVASVGDRRSGLHACRSNMHDEWLYRHEEAQSNR
jgi:uncharacterized membrane protein